jgi:hypothetical protein
MANLTELTDAELDLVTGGATPDNSGLGVLTASESGGNPYPSGGVQGRTNAGINGGLGQQGNIPGDLGPGGGQVTAGHTP